MNPDIKYANITARDIKLGERHSCPNCPLARAAGRLFPDFFVEAVYQYIYVYRDYDAMVESMLPLSEWKHDGDDFIRAFDLSLHVSPRKVKLTRVTTRLETALSNWD